MLIKRFVLVGFIIFAFIALFPSELIKNIQAGRYFCVDDNQNIYTQKDSYSIIKYSPDGEKLIVIGRKGEGPGDIKRIGWFEINPKDKMLYVTERVNGNRRVSIFSPETGKYIDNWKFDFNWNTYEGIPVIQFDHSGNVYIETVKTLWKRHQSFDIGIHEKTVLKYSYSGKILKEIYRMKSDFMAQKYGKGNVTIPHCNYLYWKINNNTIVIRENSIPHILVFDLNGQLKKAIDLNIRERRFTKQDIARWEEELLAVPFVKRGMAEGWYDVTFWRKNLPFPGVKNFSGHQMFFDPGGSLYSYIDVDESENKNTWLKIDINTGKNIVVNFPVNHRLVCINDGFFYFSIYDDEEPMVLKIKENSINNKDVMYNER